MKANFSLKDIKQVIVLLKVSTQLRNGRKG
jgi:hypothetical protein